MKFFRTPAHAQLHPEVSLAAGQVLSLTLHQPRILTATQGRLWVTVSQDGRDHFLHAGKQLCLGLGRVVIEADAGPARWGWLEMQQQAEAARHSSPVVRLRRALG
ncbi:DUF2917 domain-containing protein [Amphibiibacter pelophylacis]|uniref:DUF2917 domain-containing protein n=1 Tax=Amphibiibacter pelophylacis TaxID=1799477 RepID=A0ACC6P3I0_9BURK